MRRFEFLVPDSVPQAARLCGEGATVAKAGGIDLLDLMKEGWQRPARVVALEPVLDTGFRIEGDEVVIGAGMTLAAAARDAKLRELLPSVAQAAESTATPNVRAMATVAGNLLQRPRCWYFRSRHYNCLRNKGSLCWAQDGMHETHALFDNQPCAVVHASNLAPALVSLRADLEIETSGGRETRSLSRSYVPGSEDATREHRLEAGEVVVAVRIDRKTLGPKAGFYEVRHKQSHDWPLAAAAVNLNGSSPRLVLGAVASIPWPVRGVTDLLKEAGGAPRPSEKLLDELAERAVAGATPLPRNAWRLPLVKVCVRRAVFKALGVPEEQW